MAQSAVGLGLLAVGFVGLGGIAVVVTLLASGQMRTWLRVWPDNAGLYAETFAVWLLLYVAIALGMGFVLGLRLLPVGGWELLVHGLGMMGGLVALAWPVLRGVPWRQVRADLGLNLGRVTLLEPLFGLASYFMTIPVLGLTFFVLAAVLVAIYGPEGAKQFLANHPVSHPIQEPLARGGWWVRCQVLFVGSIVAPVVEETMFRGVLYAHLRGATRRWGSLLSIACSATVAAFLFAAMHPQGPLAIPVLMVVALGLTWAREWRGSLVPGMVFHGVHNGVLMLLLTFATT